MTGSGRTGLLLGLDIGRVNTRVSVFGISEGKYRLQASRVARTDFGHEGHLAAGVHEALGKLEQDLQGNFILPSRSQSGQVELNQQVVDQAGLVLSAFPEIRVAVLGLTASGSLAAGLELTRKLPVKLAGAFGMAHLADEPAAVEKLLEERPDMLILTGGDDLGAEAPLTRWIEVARLVCRSLPEEIRPIVFFAGNPEMIPNLRRRLEPICRLVVLPNLQPAVGERDDVPAQAAISRHVISAGMETLTGLQGLSQLAGDLVGTRDFMLGRMVRFISRSKSKRSNVGKQGEILAVDLGAGSTLVCVGKDGLSAAYRSAAWDGVFGDGISGDGIFGDGFSAAANFVHRWAAAPVSKSDVENYLANQHLFPGIIPQTLPELGMSQSLARFRIRSAMKGLVESTEGVSYDENSGLHGHYETIIASGSALTDAPTLGQAMLMLLDSLLPWRETTLVLDRYHLLPLLGLLGETEPLLPVHVLDSDAFTNLGTVIPVVSQASEGKMILSVNVTMESGKTYDVDIPKGSLRRLIIPPGESVTLTLEPLPDVDVGEGPGIKRRISVQSGALGVVIDARGRPVVLPEDEEERLERLRHWLWTLGG